MKCRNCDKSLSVSFADLGFSPPSNAYLTENDLKQSEHYFPLRVDVCESCFLVQTQDFVLPEIIFNEDYAYLSSTSQGFLDHCEDYSSKIIASLALDNNSFVIEIASNDGYLLKNFLHREIPCLGIEPTKSTADIARSKGIRVEERFFGEETAMDVSKESKADLIIANNVYAHVPDIKSFTRGLFLLLKDEGTITIEFTHLVNMLREKQFDSLYHEHFSYYSLTTVINIFERHGLRIYDVEEIPTHCGSLRIYGCKKDAIIQNNSKNIDRILKEEKEMGLDNLDSYKTFQTEIDEIKNSFLSFLLQAKKENKKVAGYGAAAKGNTLLNYAGVKPDLIPYICDMAESKQGKYMPGSHIPILNVDYLKEDKPDYVIIFPWNIAKEVIDQNNYISEWGGRFVIAVPTLEIIE